MQTVLTRDIPVHRYAAFAEVAFLERRPELKLLCANASKTGGRLTKAAVQAALPGIGDGGANNVVRWCTTLGLCDASGALTELGRDVAATGDAPVPEQGSYDLWIADDPLIGARALSVARLSIRRDEDWQAMGRAPIRPDLDRPFTSVVDPNTRFIVRAFPTNQPEPRVRVGRTSAKVRARWAIDFGAGTSKLTLAGEIEEPKVDGGEKRVLLRAAPEDGPVRADEVLDAWVNGPLAAHGRWDRANGWLRVPFRGLKPVEIQSFRKDIALGAVEVPGAGDFDDARLTGVPIAPATREDAQTWSMARIDHLIRESPAYRDRVEVRRAFAELVEGTPLASFEPKLPSHAELLRRGGDDRDRFWSIAAPVDLAPYPVDPEVLGELHLRVRQVDGPVSPRSNGTIQFGSGSGWSMRALFDALLDGTTPRRLLLVDRYVRRDDNLRVLELLVATLREVANGASLNIWTEAHEEADFERIRHLTGASFDTYQKRFGHSTANYPHDRYLVVDPLQGAPFGWQLSNSPLHARSDVSKPSPDTPLRWKELLAMRLTPDQLDPKIRAWLRRGDR
jgi:hypothetical protein